MKINVEKTKAITARKHPQINVNVVGEQIKQVSNFKYLDSQSQKMVNLTERQTLD